MDAMAPSPPAPLPRFTGARGGLGGRGSSVARAFRLEICAVCLGRLEMAAPGRKAARRISSVAVRGRERGRGSFVEIFGSIEKNEVAGGISVPPRVPVIFGIPLAVRIPRASPTGS
jgi:hypothetical protein